jgi:hypothetical protein
MTAPAKNEPGTSVAKTDRDAGLTAEGKRHMEQVRAARALTMALRNEAWSKDLSPMMVRAVAEYMRRFHLDVSEVEVLGGSIYRTGYYYRRRIAEMRSAGLVEWSEGDHIGPSAQLEAALHDTDPEIVAWAKAERFRRLKERARWEVPADATHAYVARVKLKTDEKVLEGCDWITPARTKKTKFGEKIADPVGAEEPEKTVITRAWRRCGLLVAAEIPELRSEEQAMKAGAEVVEAEIEQVAETETQRELEADQPRQMLSAPAADDPYGLKATDAAREAERVEIKTPAQKQAPAAVKAPSFPELAASIARLLKHERVSDDDRARITVDAANAQTTADLERVMDRLETIIAGDGELGL